MIQQISIYNNSQNQYAIKNQWDNKEKELNMQMNVKTSNGKELQLKTLIDSGCTYTGINKQLVKKEKNLQQKLLTIVEALTKWRQYLLDATEKFEVWTDHKNLKYFQELYKLNEWQARWYLKLQDYDFISQEIQIQKQTYCLRKTKWIL